MVQSLVAPDGELNADQLWKDVNPEQLMDAKLRCTFEMPESKDGNVSQLTTHLLKNESLMSDSLQSTGSGSGDALAKGSDTDFVRATAEVRDLREENSKMRQENLELNVSECKTAPLKVLTLFLLGTTHSIEVNAGLSEVGIKLISPISQNHLESVFTAPTRTAAANADYLGRWCVGDGYIRFDSRQVRPLNALITHQKSESLMTQDKRVVGVIGGYYLILSFLSWDSENISEN